MGDSNDPNFVLTGVMGWPVAHSRSPTIHNHWIAQHQLKGTYALLPVQPEHLHDAIKGLVALGFAGCNVTIPHKVNAMKMMDIVKGATHSKRCIARSMYSNCPLQVMK